MWLGIAGAGAGMVSLIEHATDGRTPAATAWLIAGCTAAMAGSLALVVLTMPAHAGRRVVPYALTGPAVVVLVLGAARPSPVVLASGLAAVLGIVWFEAFARHARAGAPIGDH